MSILNPNHMNSINAYLYFSVNSNPIYIMKVRKIKMSSKRQGQQQNLSEMIEKILFDVQELELLKVLINNVGMGSDEPKKLRAAIIENRENIKSKILSIFPYYQKQISYQQQIDGFTERSVPSQIQNELEEKNELLTKVGEWMQTTRKKLEEETNI